MPACYLCMQAHLSRLISCPLGVILCWALPLWSCSQWGHAQNCCATSAVRHVCQGFLQLQAASAFVAQGMSKVDRGVSLRIVV